MADEAANDEASKDDEIAPGKMVECVGTSSATMNGSVGKVVSWNTEKERWAVDFGPGVGVKNLFPKNLQPAKEKPKASAADALGSAADGKMASAKELLDSLMGANRNTKLDSSSGPTEEFLKKDVCNDFLAGFCCKHELTGTKRDIGRCSKLHSQFYLEELERHPDKEKYLRRFRDDVLASLINLEKETGLIADREERSLAAKKESMGGKNPASLFAVSNIDKEIKEVYNEAQTLLDNGNVTEAKIKQDRVQYLQQRREEVLQRYGTEKFEDHVCRDCGMRYSNGEKAHQAGRLHLSMVRAQELRESIQKERREAAKSDRDRDRDRDRRERSRSRDRKDDRERKGDRDRRR
jgi:hypothetical protein